MQRIISIIIPVFNEGEIINDLISHLRLIDNDFIKEIVVVDADPGGSTLSMIRDKSIKRLCSSIGRAVQMNAGAKAAAGNVLLFLHADTRLPDNAFSLINEVFAESTCSAGAFSLGIDSPAFIYRIIESSASARSRITKIPFGDQAIFISRDVFDKIGGYKEMPLMEDVELMQRLKKSGHGIRVLSQKVRTSSRRWDKNGAVVNTLRNWRVQLLYRLGTSPEKLAMYYYATGRRGPGKDR